ncbi:hypothetical protein LGH82_25380 [Mesorhizobium sp. PAMC28654]|uniref:hypothetical protein n=1 Tax=Mesorhizobium sp. PAMC28654 TaxID=2880934 RepID=UPI001D09D0A9|nr:hypothetical protein [Mesorhizobium sp. PAMC28654]UDL88434.1 hypothetical protein LGH82_25380 [Mesorhizobium sp. PAMC28654]
MTTPQILLKAVPTTAQAFSAGGISWTKQRGIGAMIGAERPFQGAATHEYGHFIHFARRITPLCSIISG